MAVRGGARTSLNIRSLESTYVTLQSLDVRNSKDVRVNGLH